METLLIYECHVTDLPYINYTEGRRLLWIQSRSSGRGSKQLRYCTIQCHSSGRGSKTTPLLQYSKLFNLQVFQNNSAIAEFKVIQAAGVPKQLRYCSIQNHSSCRGSKTIPLLQNSKSFKRQGFQYNSAAAVFKVIRVAGVPKQFRFCRIQSNSSGRGSNTTPLLQYSKSFKRQGFQYNSAAAVFKVIRVAGVPQQLRHCNIPSH